jgi:hypothetical protein
MTHIDDTYIELFSEQLNMLLENIAVQENLSVDLIDKIHFYAVEIYQNNLKVILAEKSAFSDETTQTMSMPTPLPVRQ